MTKPDKSTEDNNSSETEQEQRNTDQEPKVKPPVERGRTFGAAGHEKRG